MNISYISPYPVSDLPASEPPVPYDPEQYLGNHSRLDTSQQGCWCAGILINIPDLKSSTLSTAGIDWVAQSGM